MDDLKLPQQRRREAMLAAAQRWSERAAARQDDIEALQTRGPGAADSPMRNARFSARQRAFKEAITLRQIGKLPIGLERKIGPTLDFLAAAPNEAAFKAGRPVARIVASIDPQIEAVGYATGFLISPSLLVSNWHVFPNASSAVGAGANFLHDQNEHGVAVGITFELKPDIFFISDENLDFSIVGIAPKAVSGELISDLGFIGMSEGTSKILKGQAIEIIQYPDGGAKKYATTNNKLLDILDSGFLHYQTDTLEGSSGSPVYNATWELVAVHHAGIPEVRGQEIISVDNTPWTEEMGDDKVHWIANEGIRISTIVKAVSKISFTDPAKNKILKEFLTQTTDPADDVNRILSGEKITTSESLHLANANSSSRRTSVGTNLNFSGPVTIHVYGNSDPQNVQMGDLASSDIAFEKSLQFDPDYESRDGYQEDFLGEGLIVPMPGVAPDREKDMYKEDGQTLILPYHHYSLAMNKSRRLQMWSAVNIDYNPDLRKQSGRAFFGTDRWILDPRIPAKIQITNPDFYAPAKQIDCGHIVRREDSAWGENKKELEFANSDTFHWTNCTPQHQAFNRESPGSKYGRKGLWGGFESYVQKELQKHEDNTRACILAGPILKEDDPEEDFGTGSIQYPLAFWKVVAVSEDSKLRVYGFLLSQKDVVDHFGIEFSPGQYARFQKPLTEISRLAGITFSNLVAEADTANK